MQIFLMDFEVTKPDIRRLQWDWDPVIKRKRYAEYINSLSITAEGVGRWKFFSVLVQHRV